MGLGKYWNQEMSKITLTKFVYIIIIFVISTVSYILNFKCGHLHDASHYLTAGISYIRDHSDLIYPYNVGGTQNHTYKNYLTEEKTIPYRVNYPSKLYSIIIAFESYLSNSVSLLGSSIFTYLCFILSAILIWYAISNTLCNKLTAFAFTVLCVFSPVVGATLSQGNDVSGLLAISIVLYLISKKISSYDLLIGVTVGIFIHLRTQNIILLPISLLLCYCFINGWNWKISITRIILSSAIVFFSIKYCIIFIVNDATSTQSSFYSNHYSNSFYKLNEYNELYTKFIKNLEDFFVYPEIGVLTIIATVVLIMLPSKIGVIACISGMMWIALPFVVYTLDRFSGPHLRYYSGAIPLLYLSIFANILKNNLFEKNVIRAILLLLFFCAWNNRDLISKGWVKSKMTSYFYTFPRFLEVSESCKNNFNSKSVVLSNHALSSAFFKFDKIFPLIDKNEFLNLNNTNIDGIILFEAVGSPDVFFNNKTWTEFGAPPNYLRDIFGNTFSKVFTEKTSPGYANRSVSVFVYKKDDSLNIGSLLRPNIASNTTQVKSKKPVLDHDQTKLLWDCILAPNTLLVGENLKLLDNGIRIHPGGPPRNLSFNVEKKFKSVQLHAFIDNLPSSALMDSTAATVGVEVFVDGKSQGHLSVDRHQNQIFNLDLSGAKELKIVVDDGNGSNNWDWLNVGISQTN